MRALRLPLLGLLAALAAAIAPGLAHAASGAYASDLPDPSRPLSPADARTYAQAFEAMRRGDFIRGDALATQVSDDCLVGRLKLAKLMAPGHHAEYAELRDWLAAYRDQPDADRVYILAQKRRPADADAPPATSVSGAADPAWSRVERLAARYDAPKLAATPALLAPISDVDRDLQKSREAFYAGDLPRAYDLAQTSGERWVGGLAAYRMARYADALANFAALADDPAQNEWVRSAAAYWSARASTASGAPQRAPGYLRMAARTPYTFYGLIAERQLGLDSSLRDPSPTALAAPPSRIVASPRAPLSAAAADLVLSDPRGHRAAAFAQVGLRLEAGLEARTAMLAAGSDAQRKAWLSLALSLGAPLSSPDDAPRQAARRFDLTQFPTPDLDPEGGFTQDKALVYALVKQESRFNAGAASASGAYGLMQLTPATAVRVSGDQKLAHDPSLLLDARKNLKLGQAYVSRLLDQVQGDLVRAVAAYNSGPGVILKTGKALGEAADTLMVLESTPGAQTRDYAKRVMASYWIYRGILGRTSSTLDAAASGARSIMASMDR